MKISNYIFIIFARYFVIVISFQPIFLVFEGFGKGQKCACRPYKPSKEVKMAIFSER